MVTLTRSKNFSETGIYLANVGGKVYRIYCDKQTTYAPGWKLDERHVARKLRTGLHKSYIELHTFLGEKKSEALANLAEKASLGDLHNPLRGKR